jgi:hypothetical protein
MEAKNIEQYFGTLQQSTVEAWRKHLKVSKKSQHETLNDFYEDIVDVVDKLIEDYMSIHGKVENYENLLSEKDMDALKYLEMLREFTREGADELFDEDDTELFSDVDNILSVMDTAIYKLKELEENKKTYMNLKDFINEQLVCENYKPTSKPKDWEKVLKKLSSNTQYSNYSQLCDIENILKYNGDAAEWLESIESGYKVKLDKNDRIALQDIVSFYQENYEYWGMHYMDQEEEIEEFKENTPLNDNKAVNYGVECEDYYESYTYIGDNSGKKYAQLIAKYGDCSEDHSGF